MMSEAFAALRAAPIGSLMAVLAGALLGALFYGGLWWTTCRVPTSRHPGPLVLASMLLRTGVTLAGFRLVAGGQWAPLLLCLSGFALARLVVTRVTRSPAAAPVRFRSATGTRHAP
jgi:F1F0 ATPase subunit 2